MKELSLNILDISENSVKAKATLVEISITETENRLTVVITDNGTGMTEDTRLSVVDPFYTTRTTRKVGLGIPLFKFAAEQTGGSVEIESRHSDSYPETHGTTVSATFFKNHIDYTPLGDVTATVTTLIQGHSDIDFLYRHIFGDREVRLDTRELRAVLEEVPLDSYEVLQWISDNLGEQYSGFYKQ